MTSFRLSTKFLKHGENNQLDGLLGHVGEEVQVVEECGEKLEQYVLGGIRPGVGEGNGDLGGG